MHMGVVLRRNADFSERLKTIPAGLEEKKAEEEKKEDADEAAE
jgi:hypothetical protein